MSEKRSSSWKKHSLVKYGEIQKNKRRRKRSKRRGNRGQGGAGGDENVEREDLTSMLRTFVGVADRETDQGGSIDTETGREAKTS